MTFLDRIREITNKRYDGIPPEKTTVNLDDLKDLLYHFDRLDREQREQIAQERQEPCVIHLANAARSACLTGKTMILDGREYVVISKEQIDFLNAAQDRSIMV